MFTGIRKFGDKVGDKFGETLRKGRTSEFAPEVEEEKCGSEKWQNCFDRIGLLWREGLQKGCAGRRVHKCCARTSHAVRQFTPH